MRRYFLSSIEYILEDMAWEMDTLGLNLRIRMIICFFPQFTLECECNTKSTYKCICDTFFAILHVDKESVLIFLQIEELNI